MTDSQDPLNVQIVSAQASSSCRRDSLYYEFGAMRSELPVSPCDNSYNTRSGNNDFGYSIVFV